MLKNMNTPSEGLSLLEVLMAMGVLAIAVLGVISVLIACEKLNEQSHYMSLVVFAAEEKLNEVTLGIWNNGTKPADEIVLANGIYDVAQLHNLTFDVPGLPDRTDRGLVIVDSSNTNFFQITISVTYTLPSALEEVRTFSLSTTLGR